jgi:hypothetical protein
VIGRWGYFCNLGIKPLISSFLLPPPINPRVQQPLPLSFPFSFFLFFSLISRMFHLSPPFLSVLPLLISFFVLHAHTHTQSKRERPRRRENVREREREREREGATAVRWRREKKWVSGKLRPVGINGSDQQAFVVRSS